MSLAPCRTNPLPNSKRLSNAWPRSLRCSPVMMLASHLRSAMAAVPYWPCERGNSPSSRAFAVEHEHSPQALGRCVQKNPAGASPPGGYCDARSGTRHLDPHHVLKNSIQTAEDRELVDLLGHLLQSFQLLHSQQDWVLIHQPRGVQQ